MPCEKECYRTYAFCPRTLPPCATNTCGTQPTAHNNAMDAIEVLRGLVDALDIQYGGCPPYPHSVIVNNLRRRAKEVLQLHHGANVVENCSEIILNAGQKGITNES